jgi:fructose-1,6-bisphosphatase I
MKNRLKTILSNYLMLFKFIFLIYLSTINSLKIIPDKTFKQFIQKEAWDNNEINNLYHVLFSIESACADINRLIRRVSVNNLVGLQNKINIQGEEQKKLDLISNKIMKNAICCSGKVCGIVSEEDEYVCRCSDITNNVAFNGEYFVVFDPLDGSSNIDCGLPTGTIFGIYKKPKFQIGITNEAYTQKGSNLILSGYCLYSASTNLVICYDNKVNMFMYDDSLNQFILTDINIKIPKKGNIISFNEANYNNWNSNIKKYINYIKKTKGYTSRYMGALVADTHNILTNGGIFGYPSSKSTPNGKIRLVYEANPLSYIIETAGGKAINGSSPILNLQVDKIHQRTPLFYGSYDEVSLLETFS